MKFSFCTILTALLWLQACAVPSGAGLDESQKSAANKLAQLDSKDGDLLAAIDALYSEGGEPIDGDIRQAYSVSITVATGEAAEDGTPATETLGPIPTHIFPRTDSDEPVRLIPYADMDEVTTADGDVLRGDVGLAQHFAPGEIGFAIKHHRPEHREIDLTSTDPEAVAALKEHFKLQDTHIMLVVGVNRNAGFVPGGSKERPVALEAQPGVITLNNPQTYPNMRDGYPGRFGSSHYSEETGRMELDPEYAPIFFKPAFPPYIHAAGQEQAFIDNIRTMIVGFNAVSKFPVGNYNGNDPLAASTPEKIHEHVAMMIRAIAGDEAALRWWNQPENLIYCAELAHVAASAGLLVPLHPAYVVDEAQLVDLETWDRFQAEIDAHMAGRPHCRGRGDNCGPYRDSSFAKLNYNKLVRSVAITAAPDSLRPAWEYAADLAPEERGQYETAKSRLEEQLAFHPMTMADIVGSFLSVHVSRQDFSGRYMPEMARVQGALLSGMQEGILESMGLGQSQIEAALAADDYATHDQLTASRAAVGQLFARMVPIVADETFENMDAFLKALEPSMEEARLITGQRGSAVFSPPSMFHLVAHGKWNTVTYAAPGLLGLDYVGHGLHFSVLPGFNVNGF